jgi:hypothetical protein
MDSHPSSLQRELAATASTHAADPPGNWSDGDYAAGLRAFQPGARERGDFATGMRSAPLLMTTADVAAGQRTHLGVEFVRGDFATGQRTERTATPTRHIQPALQTRSRRRRSTVPVTERAW